MDTCFRRDDTVDQAPGLSAILPRRAGEGDHPKDGGGGDHELRLSPKTATLP